MTEQKTDLLAAGASEIGWTAPAGMTFDQWSAMGRTLQTIHRHAPMWLGDWMNAGERRWGETYAEALIYTDRSLEQLQQYKWVMGAVAPERRQRGLTFTHYRLVAKLPPEEQADALAWAAEENASTSELAEYIRPKAPATNQLPPPPQRQPPAPPPTPAPPPQRKMSKAERHTRVWMAWVILHGYCIFPEGIETEAFNYIVGESLDQILFGTGLEGCDIYELWTDNLTAHDLT